MSSGRVILVGAGPGDPKLLTIKAADALASADVVVYDRLVSPKVLRYASTQAERIDANGKVVIVIGGGDTGSDCVGTARRQGAKEIHQLEILPKPPEKLNPQTPWPSWPNVLRTSSSHEEGCSRRWSVLTKEFTGEGGRVSQLRGCQVEWTQVDGKWQMNETAGSDFTMKADLVLLAMGFLHVTHAGLVQNFALDLDPRGNVSVGDDSQTSVPGVFAAGDSISGASLVVRAISSGRHTAAAIDRWLKGDAA